ncbi:hypothetical protein FGO68_gene6965 [Halteria grandinella]|uniref:Uncharacterized protein n=1 Tax=Halteria grandinella TaxID=5974 RepID=A0A8J8T3X6_HALGN|nr:hypothetical protein FGO68_gene6965 [Halteria grandinella]
MCIPQIKQCFISRLQLPLLLTEKITKVLGRNQGRQFQPTLKLKNLTIKFGMNAEEAFVIPQASSLIKYWNIQEIPLSKALEKMSFWLILQKSIITRQSSGRL